MVYKSSAYKFGDTYISHSDEKINDQNSIFEFPFEVIKISKGRFRTLILDTDGNVYSSGLNINGSLGLNIPDNDGEDELCLQIKKIENIPKIIDICCGEYCNALIDIDENVYYFGSFSDSIPDVYAVHSPTLIDNFKASKVFSGIDAHNIFFIGSNNKIFCFGCNESGNLGIGNKNIQLSPVELNFDVEITDISCSFEGSLFLDTSGNVYGCGQNDCGNLGFGSYIRESLIPIGLNHKFPTVENNCLPKITRISSGFKHCLLLSVDGEVFSFGYNVCGQLGLGHKKNVYKPEKIPNLPIIIDIYCESNSSFLIDIDGNVLVFGSNAQNMLALNDSAVISCTEPVMNYNLTGIKYFNGPLNSYIKSARNLI